MEKPMIIEQILGTSHARVYRHLARHVGESQMEAEIVAATGVSRSAVNLAVRDLAESGLIVCVSRGRTRFYSADPADPVVRQFKIWETTLFLEPMLRHLRAVARRVILFGSAAQGIDSPESDIDLFIVGSDRKAIRTIVKPNIDGRRIQAVIVSDQELVSLKEDDPDFYNRVKQGLVLQEGSVGEKES